MVDHVQMMDDLGTIASGSVSAEDALQLECGVLSFSLKLEYIQSFSFEWLLHLLTRQCLFESPHGESLSEGVVLRQCLGHVVEVVSDSEVGTALLHLHCREDLVDALLREALAPVLDVPEKLAVLWISRKFTNFI